MAIRGEALSETIVTERGEELCNDATTMLQSDLSPAVPGDFSYRPIKARNGASASEILLADRDRF